MVCYFYRIWSSLYYFDEILNYPVTIVDQRQIKKRKTFEFNTLVLADGRYNFSESDLKD